MQMSDTSGIKSITEELSLEYERFIQFGQILDRRMRTYLVHYIQYKFDLTIGAPPEINEDYFDYLQKALDNIFSIDSLLPLLQGNLRLKKQVVFDILYWLKQLQKKVKVYNPWQEEKQNLESWSVNTLKIFSIRWKFLTNYLNNLYKSIEIDTAFYNNQFNVLFEDKIFDDLEDEERQRLDLLFHDILAQWDSLLYAKIIQYELSKFQEEETQFIDLMTQKVEEYKKIQEYVDPFTNYLGWDISRQLWQKTSFDLLNKYDELLQDEQSIKELANMLGSMREAEIELEQEEFETTIVRQQWVSDPLSKAEIIGIEESSDLNRIVSSEAALLSDPNTEVVFLKKFADQQLTTFRYEDRKLISSKDHITEIHHKVIQKEKGPFIICVDTSESMDGRPEQIAKVLCFGILRMAMNQNRRAFLINFSVGIQTLDLSDIANSVDDIAAFLNMSFYGGTDASLAISEALRQLNTFEYRDADILVVSDFIMSSLDEDLQYKFKFHQQNMNTQFHCLTIGKSSNKAITSLFDTNWLYNPKEKGIVKSLTEGFQTIAKR